ncbi:CPXCG motif-containing cysteine-rich protein [Luteimonas sp. 3794]|uniref:CPXCG motif-containing cysteine-rich protein n=1 Tax=Luteimonas sp. 3794 TaxID=2817730 RepID=UPI002863440C|nr:CPXCG motif-containing cysteine-rich protein [Luteimonas sp. 3794]MDR6991007.1 sarcosine oxidase delta subunit [Luteimonas sp. 3794]
MQDVARLQCPWCGERFETLVDASAGDADYIEDCPVCCRPIEMHLSIDEDGTHLAAGRED